MNPAKNIPQDPALPQLARVLDTDFMAREFGRQFFGANGRGAASNAFRIEHCEIERVKYKPGIKCTVGYRLALHDTINGKDREQLLSGCIYSTGGSEARYARAMREPLVAPTVGPALFRIEALDMVVWSFPNDRKLHGLRVLFDDTHLSTELLPPMVERRWGANWRIVDMLRSVANYVPESRCCVRMELAIENEGTGDGRHWVIFGKTYYDDYGEQAHRTLQQLWESQRQAGVEVGVPRPLCYESNHRIFWQEGLAGQTLPQSIALGGDESVLLAKAAEVVAQLHRTPIDVNRELKSKDIVKSLQRLANVIGDARPASRSSLSRVVERLTRDAPGMSSGGVATIHGDLHPKNIFVDGSRVSLIDLDDVSRGPAAYDIGSFVARMLYDALLIEQSVASVRPAIAGFVDSYRVRTAHPVSTHDVVWHTAAALISERAFRCMTRMKAGRLEILDGLIALADRISRGTETVGIPVDLDRQDVRHSGVSGTG